MAKLWRRPCGLTAFDSMPAATASFFIVFQNSCELCEHGSTPNATAERCDCLLHQRTVDGRRCGLCPGNNIVFNDATFGSSCEVCENGSTASSTTETCDCLPHQTVVNGRNCGVCGPNDIVFNNTCETCRAGSTVAAGTETCACLPQQIIDSHGNCEPCPGNRVAQNGACVLCPLFQSPVGGTNVCRCDDPQNPVCSGPDGAICVCRASCPPGLLPDPISGRCRRPIP